MFFGSISICFYESSQEVILKVVESNPWSLAFNDSLKGTWNKIWQLMQSQMRLLTTHLLNNIITVKRFDGYSNCMVQEFASLLTLKLCILILYTQHAQDK